MKLVVIADIHGRTNWKDVIAQHPDADQVVFTGDYVDTHDDITIVEILHNLKEIIAYGRANPNTIFLLGNHDYPYIFGAMGTYQCSGFKSAAYHNYHQLFIENIDLFKFAHLEGKYLFSHAGITTKWFNKYKDFMRDHLIMITDGEADYLLDDPSALLNYGMETKEIQAAMWEVGPARGGWHGSNGSPIWADQSETRFGALRGYTHIVGHTPQTKTGVKYFKIDNDTGIWYCDALFKEQTPSIKNHLVLYID